MRIVLERHHYAPELNKALIGPNGTVIPAPGCTSIREVRQSLFSPLKRSGRHVVLSTHYPQEKAWLNRRHAGFCDSLQELSIHLHTLRAKLVPGQGAAVKVQSRLVG